MCCDIRDGDFRRVVQGRLENGMAGVLKMLELGGVAGRVTIFKRELPV